MSCHAHNYKRNSELILKGFDKKMILFVSCFEKSVFIEKSSITIKSLKAILNRREWAVKRGKGYVCLDRKKSNNYLFLPQL